jgi:hypothetical protein
VSSDLIPAKWRTPAVQKWLAGALAVTIGIIGVPKTKELIAVWSDYAQANPFPIPEAVTNALPGGVTVIDTSVVEVVDFREPNLKVTKWDSHSIRIKHDLPASMWSGGLPIIGVGKVQPDGSCKICKFDFLKRTNPRKSLENLHGSEYGQTLREGDTVRWQVWSRNERSDVCETPWVWENCP